MIRNSGRPSRRRGGILIVVLVAAIVISLLIAATLSRGIRQRASAALEARKLQADWLAEAGLNRAAARLRGPEAAEYRGETWAVPAEALDGRHAGSVALEVEAVENHPELRRVRARADFPSGGNEPTGRARRSKTLLIRVAEPRKDQMP